MIHSLSNIWHLWNCYKVHFHPAAHYVFLHIKNLSPNITKKVSRVWAEIEKLVKRHKQNATKWNIKQDCHIISRGTSGPLYSGRLSFMCTLFISDDEWSHCVLCLAQTEELAPPAVCIVVLDSEYNCGRWKMQIFGNVVTLQTLFGWKPDNSWVTDLLYMMSLYCAWTIFITVTVFTFGIVIQSSGLHIL